MLILSCTLKGLRYGLISYCMMKGYYRLYSLRSLSFKPVLRDPEGQTEVESVENNLHLYRLYSNTSELYYIHRRTKP